jgi:hypothetical protein
MIYGLLRKAVEGNEIEYEMVKQENVSEDQYSDEFDTDFEELASTDGEGNKNTLGSTTSTVSDTWSLVAKKKKGKMPVTSNPHTKDKKKMVYKPHRFVNNPL